MSARPTTGNTVARYRFDPDRPTMYRAMYNDDTYGPERETREQAEADYTKPLTIDQECQLIEVHRAARAHKHLASAITRCEREITPLLGNHPVFEACARDYSTHCKANRDALALGIPSEIAAKHNDAGEAEGADDTRMMQLDEIAALIDMYEGN